MAYDCKAFANLKLTELQKKNASWLIKYMDQYKITNPYIRNAILTICYKESGYIAKVENCYSRKDGVPKVRRIFGARLSAYTDAEVLKLLDNCIDFFDAVYGSRVDKIIGFKTGNNNKGDGYKYRGRGYNGITFKVQYEAIGKKMGLDLVKNPELLETPENQAKSTIIYFLDAFKSQDKRIKNKPYMNGKSALMVDNYDSALKLIYNINAGLGFDMDNLIKDDKTGGWKITQCVKDQIPKLLGSIKPASNNIPILLAGIFFFTIVNPKWIKKNLPKSITKFLK